MDDKIKNDCKNVSKIDDEELYNVSEEQVKKIHELVVKQIKMRKENFCIKENK